jgi:hypothetical protein
MLRGQHPVWWLWAAPTSRKTNSTTHSAVPWLFAVIQRDPIPSTQTIPRNGVQEGLMPREGIIWISVYCPSSNSEWDGSFFWYLTFGMLALNFSHASNSLTNHRKCGNYLCWMKSHLKHPRCESRRDTCLEEKRVYRWNVKGCEWDEREQWGEYDHSVCMCNCQIIKETF